MSACRAASRDIFAITANVAFALLRVLSNDIADIEPKLPKLFARWSELKPGHLLIIE